MIGNGEQFTLTGVPCEVYDLRLVDEDDDVCILESVALCSHEAEWHLTDKILLDCQANTEE